jgi:S-formylglutathione hydrolase FrmB
MRKIFFLISLCLIAFNVSASTVTTVQIYSEKMDKDVPASVVLPDSYAAGTDRFAVLYLLHGAGGDYKGWVSKAPVGELADTYGIIIICPDADKTSWYFDSPINPKSQYETFMSKELVKYVDANYRTRALREFRAIAGLSMGGHGAMFLAIRHKDVFSTVCCMSGGVDIRPFPNNWGIKDRIGDIETYPKRWEELTVIDNAKTLKDGDLAISIDCGVSDFFIGVNRALRKQLLDANISHEYSERPGAHSWDYWKYSIRYQMVFINEKFKKASGK